MHMHTAQIDSSYPLSVEDNLPLVVSCREPKWPYFFYSNVTYIQQQMWTDITQLLWQLLLRALILLRLWHHMNHVLT